MGHLECRRERVGGRLEMSATVVTYGQIAVRGFKKGEQRRTWRHDQLMRTTSARTQPCRPLCPWACVPSLPPWLCLKLSSGDCGLQVRTGTEPRIRREKPSKKKWFSSRVLVKMYLQRHPLVVDKIINRRLSAPSCFLARQMLYPVRNKPCIWDSLETQPLALCTKLPHTVTRGCQAAKGPLVFLHDR